MIGKLIRIKVSNTKAANELILLSLVNISKQSTKLKRQANSLLNLVINIILNVTYNTLLYINTNNLRV